MHRTDRAGNRRQRDKLHVLILRTVLDDLRQSKSEVTVPPWLFKAQSADHSLPDTLKDFGRPTRPHAAKETARHEPQKTTRTPP